MYLVSILYLKSLPLHINQNNLAIAGRLEIFAIYRSFEENLARESAGSDEEDVIHVVIREIEEREFLLARLLDEGEDISSREREDIIVEFVWRTDSFSRIVDTDSRIRGDNLLISGLFECENIPIHPIACFFEFLRIDIRYTHRTGSFIF